MKTIELTFIKKVADSVDAFNNPTYTTQNIAVPGCLIAPITEPTSAREQQAIEQSKDQIRIHIPKSYTGDVSNSDIVYGGKTFHLDSDSVSFMNENTPTPWNRYIRAESVNA